MPRDPQTTPEKQIQFVDLATGKALGTSAPFLPPSRAAWVYWIAGKWREVANAKN